jgi:hypothetical protein
MAGKKLKLRSRYSIGEWYGSRFEQLSPKQRRDQGKLHKGLKNITGLDCPFQPNRICSKKGGVCSLQKYEKIGDRSVTLTGPLVTTCPNRFLEDGTIFRWIGEIILQTREPIVLGQVGFLDRLRAPEESIDDEDSRDFIGRIDNVLVHPTKQPMDWCAVELQAVYFSGKSMNQEFTMLARQEYEDIPFPAAQRRPDWRSSGPKRLLPQLQTKVPTIRTWGKKMAVVIDEAFFSSLVGLQPERHLSNAEIAWFVVQYELKSNRWKLTPKEVVYSQLHTSVKALTGGVPVSKEKFEAQLQEKLRLKSKT